jgi:hypothetical protein
MNDLRIPQTMDFETAVKLNIYETVAETTQAPTLVEVAAALDRPAGEVEMAFRGLAQKRLLVLEPGDDSRIRMAPPFSGIETQHLVKIGGKSYYGNCAWDAFGVAAALHQDADIVSQCPDCGEALGYQIRDGQPQARESVVHFAVPAAKWWEDIIYT